MELKAKLVVLQRQAHVARLRRHRDDAAARAIQKQIGEVVVRLIVAELAEVYAGETT